MAVEHWLRLTRDDAEAERRATAAVAEAWLDRVSCFGTPDRLAEPSTVRLGSSDGSAPMSLAAPSARVPPRVAPDAAWFGRAAAGLLHVTELRVYDNSAEADPSAGVTPEPVLLLHVDRGQVAHSSALRRTPAWAQPIVKTARTLANAERRRRSL